MLNLIQHHKIKDLRDPEIVDPEILAISRAQFRG